MASEKPITFFKRDPYPDTKRKVMVHPRFHVAAALQYESEFGGRYTALCGYSYYKSKCSISRAMKAPSKKGMCLNCAKAMEKQARKEQ